MPSRHRRIAFNPDGPFVARRNFLFDGARTRPGELFPHAGIKLHRLRQLFELGKIGLAPTNKVRNGLFGFSGQTIPPLEPKWREMNDKDLLAYAFSKTGVRRRNPDRAREELEAIEV